jgi:preprotein translocase subunit YajC
METFDNSSALVQFLPLALVMIVLYLLKVRPKRRRARVHKRMLATLRRGSRVAIGGGIIGTVARIGDFQDVMVDIADGVQVRVMREAISDVLAAEGLNRAGAPRVHQQKDGLAGEMTRQQKAILAAIVDVDRMLETPFTPARASLLTVTRELVAMRDRLKAALEPVA